MIPLPHLLFLLPFLKAWMEHSLRSGFRIGGALPPDNQPHFSSSNLCLRRANGEMIVVVLFRCESKSYANFSAPGDGFFPTITRYDTPSGVLRQPNDPGMFYYGFRYYVPETGRWASRDPIGERGGLNLYAFVGNDGVGQWDLLGLSYFRIVRFDSAIGHEFLVIGLEFRGYYPSGDPDLTLPGSSGGLPIYDDESQWIDEWDQGRRYAQQLQHRQDWKGWNTSVRTSGKLKAGKSKDCPCEDATRDQIESCLLEITEPGQCDLNYYALGGNCRTRVRQALSDCCLKRGGLFHSPPNEDDEGRRFTPIRPVGPKVRR